MLALNLPGLITKRSQSDEDDANEVATPEEVAKFLRKLVDDRRRDPSDWCLSTSAIFLGSDAMAFYYRPLTRHSR